MGICEPIISIVVPLYNKEQAITKTIQSVLCQTITDFELIVVDDGSTDYSSSRVNAFEDNRIKLFHKENGGVSSARNYGIRAARSQYIAFLDGDDIWAETYLEEQLKLIADFPDAGMWGVNYAFVKNGKSFPCAQGMGDGFRGYVENYFGTSHNDLFCSTSVVIKKSVFDVAGTFDERISSSEDLDEWYRIILKFPVVYYDKVLAYYNQDAENRCAYDTEVRFPLHRDVKFYIEKYAEDCRENKQFSRYINNYVASRLLLDGYYFGTKIERSESDIVVKKLCYKDMHPKYRLIFKTPRFVGWLIYKMVCLKKKIRN